MTLSKSRIRCLCLIIPYMLVIALSAASAFGEPTRTELVTMRDGARLVTDVYLPKRDGPFPTVVVRTPYPRGTPDERLLDEGYAVVIQSTRGRFGSDGGGSLVFLDDGWGENQDGYDCIEWVAKQRWCNGKIGTLGVSAPGITQYLMAGSAPPSLDCQVVGLAPCDLYNQCAFQGGALRKEQIEGWLAANQFEEENLRTIAQNPAYSDLWRGLDLSTRFRQANAPAVHIAGWYDTFLQGNIDAFVGLQYRGDKRARSNQKLIIGPYIHGGRRHGGEIDYANYDPPDGGIPHLLWFDYWLKGVDNGVNDRPAVLYYTMGADGREDAPGNEWRTSDVWPIPAKATPYYLRPGRHLSTRRPVQKESSLSFKFDPENPVPTVGGNNLLMPAGPRNQRRVEARSDVLVFTSAPLEEPLEVTGRIKVKLWASSSAKDTDFTAKLTDVYPDGRSMLVADGIIRARYRGSFEKPKLITPGEVYEFEIDLWSTSIIFDKGHQIRVAISSSNYPRFDVNPNTGELSFNATRTEIANNTIYFDASRPSAIYLPIVEPGKK